MNNNYAVFTVCNLAYLSKALVLASSVLKYNGVRLKIYLIEKKIPNLDLSRFEADFFWIEDLNVPNFYELAFKYDIIELSTSVKPWISLRILSKYKNVIFLDPDTCTYSTLSPILDDLQKTSILLTPHYTTKQTDNLSESDTAMMRFGSFNLGFFAIRDTLQGIDFLTWWSQRCFDLCYMESQFGLSTDQKWVTIAPCLFQDLHVSFNLGYNVAPWNSFERTISKNEKGEYTVNGRFRLVFFHFSNFNKNDLGYMTKRSLYEKNKDRLDIFELSENYLIELESYGTDLVKIKYGFDYMSSGEYISPTLRRAYACFMSKFPKNNNPFDSSGPVYSFAKQNFLFESKNSVFRAATQSELISHGIKLKLVYIFFRLVLRIIGPNKFHNFSRLLVYLSSYRQNEGLWKFN